MPSTGQEKERREPLVLVDTENLPQEEWLEWRRRGIGGSDVAAITGISPFRTARDIYYDKLGIAAVEENEGNWVAMEMGHLLEDLVAEIFRRKTGFEIFQAKKMFCHPLHPFMLADVDYLAAMPDGSKAILEIKTTNYNAKDHWWKDGRETVLDYYEIQGRHYMAVLDIDRVFFCCLYGNTEDEAIIREIRRDRAYEEEMIFLEQEFWENHVLKKDPPPYLEDGDLITASARKYCGPADKNAPPIVLEGEMKSLLMRYMQLQEEKKNSEKYSKKLEDDMQRLKAILAAGMGTSCTAVCDKGESHYTVTYNPVRKPIVDKDSLARLKLLFPEIYEQFVTTLEFRKFHVKVSRQDAA
ncbi:MAG: YqaJ viral recombinase family protein [Lachnospiraceae bacterium]|nr:YqaJ viral recombinase family protein [Lachnospiraceae bacterium]MCM1239374.1 YqaJ viral recombinase family protein [Lachnospiraceae bacterium]